MPPDQLPIDESASINFKFETFGELAKVFGERRARALLRAQQRKSGNSSDVLTSADIETALKFLRGEMTGAQSIRALKAFRHYFASNERARKACEAYLKNLGQ